MDSFIISTNNVINNISNILIIVYFINVEYYKY